MSAPATPKSVLRTAQRYTKRLQGGALIMRTADGRFQWSDGKPVAPRTLSYMLDSGIIAPRGDELLGDSSHSQTWGLK